jgi:hypothetical protein
MTIAIILLVVGGVALLVGATRRADLGTFRPTVTVSSQLPDAPDMLERIAAGIPGVPGARLQERRGDVLLVTAGPSMQCLNRGAGIFVRISRGAGGIQLDGRPKVALNTNDHAALVEFERQLRHAVAASD